MRLKIYYQPDEIEENLYTFGNEWMLADTYQEYKGAYHKYLTGEVYTLKSYDSTLSKPLVEYQNINSQVYRYSNLRPDIKILNKIHVYSHTPIITQENLHAGYIYRYFVQKINESWIIEINEQLYRTLVLDGLEAILYRFVEVKWYITGSLEDVKIGLANTPGVITKNIQSIRNASQIIPNISKKLSNPAEFYLDTSYKIAVDINGLDS